MRLPPFPKPYPDELLFSALCRWRVNLQSFSNLEAKKLLRTTGWRGTDSFDPIFPIGADALIERLPTGFLSPDSIVQNHSILPFFRPFISAKSFNAIFARTLSWNAPKTRLLGKSILKFCPSCLEDDRNNHRQPYLRCIHQLVGCVRCYSHGAKLAEIESTTKEGYPFLDLNRIPVLKQNLNADESPLLSTLAKDFFTVPRDFSSVNSDQVWLGIRLRLMGGDGRQTVAPITKTRFIDFCQSVRSEIDLHYADLKALNVLNRCHPSTPALALLLIRFLGETPASFVAGLSDSDREVSPMRACRHPECIDYGRPTLAGRKATVMGKQYRRFHCAKCGFAYLLTRDQLSEPNPKLVRICELPAKEMHAFVAAWKDPKVSFAEMRSQFRLSPTQVLFLARFHGLPVSRDGLEVKKRALQSFLKRERSDAVSLDIAKRIILQAQAEDPQTTVEGFLFDRRKKIRLAAVHIHGREPEWLRALIQSSRRVKKKKH